MRVNMPSTIFPLWPHVVFGVLEPFSLIAAWSLPVGNVHNFILDQVPNIAAPTSLHPSSVALAYQLANGYGLLSLLGVAICWTTSEPIVLRNYLIALAIADVGHIYVTAIAMGFQNFINIQSWNLLTWGNIMITAFLLINRLAYLRGYFGKAKSPRYRRKWY